LEAKNRQWAEHHGKKPKRGGERKTLRFLRGPKFETIREKAPGF